MEIKKLKIPEQFGSLYVCPVPERNLKAEHETAHFLLNTAVQELFKTENPVLSYGTYEKPYFRDYPEIHFNLSHCKGLAVCLISEFECGADVETCRKVRPAVARRVFSPEEQEMLTQSADPDQLFTQLWTLKESYVKAIGRGIGFPMNQVCFRFESERIFCNQKNAEFHQIQYENDTISLCILTPV
jgi:4'-phosphopantetheinyl transferase